MRRAAAIFLTIAFTLARAVSAGADDCEPNDAMTTGALLQPLPCVSLSGEIDPVGDTDYFRVSAVGGERIWISTISDGDTVVYLYGPAGAMVESDDDDGEDLASLIAGAPLADAGTYYIKVYEYGNNAAISYDLYVTVFDGLDMVSETSMSNETASQAQVVGLGHWVSGSMSSSTDVDWYRFSAAAGNLLVFQLDDSPDGTGSFNTALGLYSSTGTTLLAEGNHEGTGPDEPEDLIYYNTSGRDLWLSVSNGASSITPGAYYLAMSVAEDHVCLNTPTPTASPSPIAPTPSAPPPTRSPVPTASPPPAPSPTQAPYMIRMFDNFFVPEILRVDPGRTVAWRNLGEDPHTTTCIGEWNSGTMLPKDVYEHTFSREGIYNYRCQYYPVGMTGRIICGPATPTPTATLTLSTTPTPVKTPTPPTTPPPVDTGHLVIDSGDYNGDGTSDIAIFRGGGGLWSVRGVTRVYYGSSSDLPVPGDYEGDGTADIGIFRGSSGLWGIRGVTRIYYGSSSDIPIPGDYNGDGSCDVGIFRGSSGLWAVTGVTRAYFGSSVDLPVPGDYDGDGLKEIAIFRGSSGLWAIQGLPRVYYGSSSDSVVPGDYNGDGTWEVGIFRSSAGMWGISGVTRAYYGSPSDQPVPADFNGDGTDDMAVFRETAGLWAVSGMTRAYYGSTGDLPVTR